MHGTGYDCWPKGQLDSSKLAVSDTVMAGTTPIIAVVDDGPSVLTALSRLLRVHSFGARTYGSALEFLASLSAETPDCLIVDLQMPGMNGLELLRYLTGRGIDVPTIIITAHDGNDVRQHCECAGIAGYLLKPINDKDLVGTITKVTRGDD
jgi:FixJ family two-component response regulator